MIQFRLPLLLQLSWLSLFVACNTSHADLPDDALTAAKNATTFLTDEVSTRGGYLWRYSADLKLREGEGVVDSETVWVQPPGTPSIGEAFVRLYEATGDIQFLKAAVAAGEALRKGQMRSGGWQATVEFDPERRKRWAYRVEESRRKSKDQSSLDDDKTQSAMRFIMLLDRALEFQDVGVHEMALYALDGLLNKGQLTNGGFPQVWTDEKIEQTGMEIKTATYPDSWPNKYPGHQQYWYRYTLNDNLAPDVMRTLLMADEIYGKSGRGNTPYFAAAKKLADSLLLAQMPEPQPAWAQQYSFEMQPIWARKFEPAAISGGESQGVIETLMLVYSKTGDRKYLESIPRALDYLKRSELPDRRLARFYELKTNRPLYFTKDYQLTHDDSNVPTHYAFKIRSQVDRLSKIYERLLNLPIGELSQYEPQPGKFGEDVIRRVISALDERGAWITNEGLRFHKQPGPVVEMRIAVANLNLLAQYLAQQ